MRREEEAILGRMEALRSAAREATAVFLEHAPPRGHGRVPLSEGVYLAYRRVEREYGVFIEQPGGMVTALDKAIDRHLIDGCLSIQALFDEVQTNAKRDAERRESALEEVSDFIGELDRRQRGRD